MKDMKSLAETLEKMNDDMNNRLQTANHERRKVVFISAFTVAFIVSYMVTVMLLSR